MTKAEKLDHIVNEIVGALDGPCPIAVIDCCARALDPELQTNNFEQYGTIFTEYSFTDSSSTTYGRED